jgi:hypothetical protein
VAHVKKTAAVAGCRQTPGDDLARMQWAKSPDCEAWVRRRLNYMQSMAIMSVTGSKPRCLAWLREGQGNHRS